MKRSEIDATEAAAKAAGKALKETLKRIQRSNIRILMKMKGYDSQLFDVILVAHTGEHPRIIAHPRITAHIRHARSDWANATHLSPFQLRNFATVLEHFNEWKDDKHESPFPSVAWLGTPSEEQMGY